MKRLAALGVVVVICTLSLKVSAFGQETQTSLSEADRTFLMEAAQGGLFEVTLGKMASQRASAADVKEFAQLMVTDHSKANDELKQLAQKKGVTLPTELDAKHSEKIESIAAKSGSEFDRAYMEEMVKDHEKDVKSFQKEAAEGEDAEIKAFAARTVPILEQHLQKAQGIFQQLETAACGK
ncbi:MAG TPA: DUF4142 domain-containing protein [Thermodesulfobacteriota bacterium]|nr:DUF4142 domain-containing protein [Thermodesulfobacteriota bacterium]